MTDNSEEDVSNLIDEWQEFEGEQEEQDTGDDEPDEEEPGSGDADIDADAMDMGLEGDAAEVFEEAFEGMAPDNPEVLDMDLEDALVEAFEEDDDDEEDEEDDDDEEDEGEACVGSTPMQLTPLGERGSVDVMLNYIAADALKEQTVVSTDPTEDQMGALHPQLADEIVVNEDLNGDEYRGSFSQGLEVHVDEPDFDTAHNAIATVMTPTEDKLRRDPDAEITPESLYKSRTPSCHPDYDHIRTFDISREGDAASFVNRGPWTVRRLNIQDLISELASRSYESDDGALVVVHATPFK